jgi:hypothetical protein
MKVQALGTNLRGVGRIHQDQLHPLFQALVSQQQTELVECPAIASPPFPFGAKHLVGTFPDPGQLLQGNGLVFGFGLFGQSTADGVIHLGLEASFSSTQPCQELSASSATTRIRRSAPPIPRRG